MHLNWAPELEIEETNFSSDKCLNLFMNICQVSKEGMGYL